VIVGGIEAVVRTLADGADELVDHRRAGPCRSEATALVELGQHDDGRERIALDDDLPAAVRRLDGRRDHLVRAAFDDHRGNRGARRAGAEKPKERDPCASPGEHFKLADRSPVFPREVQAPRDGRMSMSGGREGCPPVRTGSRGDLAIRVPRP